MRRFWSIGRLWDGLAIAAVLFVGWKLFIAPRALSPADAYPAPPVAYPLLAGGVFRIPQAHGRPLVLDFYASWCTPCRIETPMIAAWARSHPQTRVLPVDVGEPRAVVAEFARRNHLGDVAYDPRATSHVMFGIEGYPTVVVIDPRGRVRAKWSGLNPAIDLALNNAERRLR